MNIITNYKQVVHLEQEIGINWTKFYMNEKLTNKGWTAWTVHYKTKNNGFPWTNDFFKRTYEKPWIRLIQKRSV